MNDKIKAEIEYLRQWLLFSVIAIFGITGWLFSYKDPDFWLYIAILGLFFFTFSIILIHKKIINKFKQWK